MKEPSRKPKQTIKGVRAVFEGEQTYSFPPEQVFPLLCPVREYEYLPPWECDVVYLASGKAEDGGVFTTGRLGVQGRQDRAAGGHQGLVRRSVSSA